MVIMTHEGGVNSDGVQEVEMELVQLQPLEQP